jgi:hypothetical protein
MPQRFPLCNRITNTLKLKSGFGFSETARSPRHAGLAGSPGSDWRASGEPQSKGLSAVPVDGGDWKSHLRVLGIHRKCLLSIPGVVGIGPGYRRRDGEKTDERCAVVFVAQKHSLGALRRSKATRVPERLTAGEVTVPVDVVELGKLRRQAAGDGVGAKGSLKGTIGAYALDLALGGKVAITAMHLFDGKPTGGLTPCASPAPGQPGSARIGVLRRGTKDGTDAAAISLAPGVEAINRLPVFGQMRGPREVTMDDDGQEVGLWGAETRMAVVGWIRQPIIDIPEEKLKSAILVDIFTNDGDSGAALVDTAGALLGFLVGEIGPDTAPLRVFTPAKLALELLACHIPESGVLA